MLDDGTVTTLQDALNGLEKGGWSALPALARLAESGQRVMIDRDISAKLGAPVVILHAAPTPPQGLTPRQTDVAQAVARGHSNAEIATELGISLATTKDHVHAILKRLGLTRRSEIAALCHGTQPSAPHHSR